MKKISFALFSLSLILAACSAGGLRPTERQEIGNISFQSLEGFSVETDGEGGIFIGSPDAEISVFMVYLPNDFFDESKAPTVVGAEYVEEVIPVDILIFLGFYNMELQPIHRYRHGDFAGFSRPFVSSSDGGDPIEGEWLFYKVGDYTFVAMGSVVRVEGNNRWDPQGKEAFDAIVESVEFVQ